MHFCVSSIAAWWFIWRLCYIRNFLLFPTHLMCSRHLISERLGTYSWFQPGSVKLFYSAITPVSTFSRHLSYRSTGWEVDTKSASLASSSRAVRGCDACTVHDVGTYRAFTYVLDTVLAGTCSRNTPFLVVWTGSKESCSQSCTENLFREYFAGVVYREHIWTGPEWST